MSENISTEDADLLISSTGLDLTECDREPIHLLGNIQPLGVLLGVDPTSGIIRVASDNAATLFNRPAGELPGAGLSTIIENASSLLAPEHDHGTEPGLLTTSLRRPDGSTLDVSIHQAQGLRILEFEPTDRPTHFGFPPYYGSLRRAMFRLQEATTLASACDIVVREVRRVTGYDRVMVYRFGPDGAGEVVAENKRADLSPYLGLHYPASDIPVQARSLYERNWIRAIERVDYEPAGLLVDADLGLEGTLDLSGSVLRSVSPIHREYLRNMGVQASMSVSILRNGRLWGLIACHHGSPLWPPSEFRAACELLGVSVSMQLSGLEYQDDAAYREQIAVTQLQLFDRMTRVEDVASSLTGHDPSILDVARAHGASVRIGETHILIGRTPDRTQIDAILATIPASEPGRAFATDCLRDLAPDFAEFAHLASGVLAVRLARGRRDHLLWFRSEALSSVIWAGNPNKPVEQVSGEIRLSPRTSFARWQETVRWHSQGWEGVEIEAAENLWRTISEVVLRSATELAELNSELARSNNELDAFAYIASHDLKEPLRGINNFTTFVLEDAGEALSDPDRDRLKTVQRLSRRMDLLLDSLLRFSQVGRAEFDLSPLSLDDVLDDVLETLGPRLVETGVEVRRPAPLPVVNADAVRLHEVLSNLISNAQKYRNAERPWVEVGMGSNTVPESSGPPQPALYVRDNGIGIAPERRGDIFKIFRRLHRRDEYGGGAGAGLTIAQKIVERHGGRLWVESTPGVGSTFWMTLPSIGETDQSTSGTQ